MADMSKNQPLIGVALPLPYDPLTGRPNPNSPFLPSVAAHDVGPAPDPAPFGSGWPLDWLRPHAPDPFVEHWDPFGPVPAGSVPAWPPVIPDDPLPGPEVQPMMDAWITDGVLSTPATEERGEKLSVYFDADFQAEFRKAVAYHGLPSRGFLLDWLSCIMTLPEMLREWGQGLEDPIRIELAAQKAVWVAQGKQTPADAK